MTERMIPIRLQWEHPSDGVELVFDEALAERRGGDGRLVKLCSPRITPATYEVTNLENLVVLRFVNCANDEERVAFLSRFGFLQEHWGREAYMSAVEVAQGRLMTGLMLFTSDLFSDPTAQANHILDEMRHEVGLRPSFEMSGARSLRLILHPNSLSSFMAMEVALAHEAGAAAANCQHCNKFFLTGPLTGRRSHAKYCSDRCRVAAMRRAELSQGGWPMSIRKRTWKTAKGEAKTAWIVDYVDTRGTRRLKTFAKKKEADAFQATAKVEVREGIHVADRDTVTIATAGSLWITSGEGAGLERSTVNQRKRHLALHIEPLIGDMLLSKLTVPAVRDFEDGLRREGRSPAMVKKVLTSLGSILSDANERGLSTRNPVRDIRGGRKGRDVADGETPETAASRSGCTYPSRDEIKAFLAALDGNWRPLFVIAVFTGMRSSELRGLRWQDVDFKRSEIHVNQRADEFGEIGPPKTDAGLRTIPVPPVVVNALKEHRLRQPNGVGLRLRQSGRPRRGRTRTS